MTRTHNPVSRRALLRGGGLLAVSGAALAACGGSTTTGIARIGESPTPTDLPVVDVDDVVLMRTAMSMELLAARILGSDEVVAAGSGAGKELAAAFASRHSAHAASIGSRIVALGGEAVDAPNAKLMSVYGDKAIALVGESDNGAADVLALVHAVEHLIAATHQLLVASIGTSTDRALLAGLSVSASSRSAAAAQTIHPGTVGFVPGVDENGAEIVSTLPHAFGQTTSVQVTLGKPNEVGVRTVVTMDTPSLNSYVY